MGIVSTASIRSLYVLFELGARWGASRPMIPLMAPGTSTAILGGPLAGLNALRAESTAQLHQLLSEIARTLSLELESAASFQEQLQAVTTVEPARPEPVEQGSSTRKADWTVPKEAESILSALVSVSDGAIPEDLAGEAGLSEPKTQYFLDLLQEQGLVEQVRYSSRPSDYYLTSKGRKYLFEHGLLE